MACLAEGLTYAEIGDADAGVLNVVVDLSGENELGLWGQKRALLYTCGGFSHGVLVFRKEG